MSTAARDDLEQVVRSVQQDPSAALARASAALSGDLEYRDRALARWAQGMARRELGEFVAARVDLEEAWRLATALDEPALAGRIAITLSLVVALQGELSGALDILDVSEPFVDDTARGHLKLQRGVILYQQGAFVPAHGAFTEALDLLTNAGDGLGELRARVSAGALLSYLGRLEEARGHLVVAAELACTLHQTLLGATAAHNLAHIEVLSGDLPAAFEAFDAAAQRYDRSGYSGPYTRQLVVDHARALLHANLLDEAREMADRAVEQSERTEGELDLAESLLIAAEARAASGDVQGAMAAAQRSVDEFAQRGRATWAALARTILLRARVTDGDAGSAIVTELAQNAGELDAFGCRSDALRCRLLEVEVRLQLGDVVGADGRLRRIAPAVRQTVAEQPTALRLRALVEMAKGDRPRARRAVNLGVRLLTEQQATLGAVELRAHASANSVGLATLGVRLAITDRRPRELLGHLETTRRTTSLLAVSRPPDDEVLATLLADLRRISSELRDVELDADRRSRLQVVHVHLERRVRNHVRRTPASGARTDIALSTAIGRLGHRTLIEYANLDGRLLAVTVIDGRTTMEDLGSIEGLVGDIEGCSLALHRLNRRQGSAASRAAAADTLSAITNELSARLLPPRALRSSRPFVIVPTGVLHALPWSALPGLTGRAVAVAPSLTGWAIAAERATTTEHVALVAGPGLEHADAEIDALRTVHDAPTTLTGAAATADVVLEAIGKSDLVHLACHGSYRADNPLFSTLRFDDGPLNAYDLERCAAIPRTVVLSACNVAMGAPAGGGALLGLAAALMTFGASSVIAPLTPVSDERVVAAMVQLHRGILDGVDPATALARVTVADDGRLDPTAAAFVVIGA